MRTQNRDRFTHKDTHTNDSPRHCSARTKDAGNDRACERKRGQRESYTERKRYSRIYRYGNSRITIGFRSFREKEIEKVEGGDRERFLRVSFERKSEKKISKREREALIVMLEMAR